MSEYFDVANFNISKKKSKVIDKQQLTTDNYIDEIPINNKRHAALLSRQKTYAIVTNDSLNEVADKLEAKDENYSDIESKCVAAKRTDLSEIVETQSRFTTSDRATTAITNATWKTFKIPIIIDKSKLRWATKRKFSEIDHELVLFGSSLFYDSRKDLTIFQKKKK